MGKLHTSAVKRKAQSVSYPKVRRLRRGDTDGGGRLVPGEIGLEMGVPRLQADLRGWVDMVLSWSLSGIRQKGRQEDTWRPVCPRRAWGRAL